MLYDVCVADTSILNMFDAVRLYVADFLARRGRRDQAEACVMRVPPLPLFLLGHLWAHTYS